MEAQPEIQPITGPHVQIIQREGQVVEQGLSR